MKKLKSLIVMGVVLVLLLAWAGTASATPHFLYLETDPLPKVIPSTQEVKIYFGHPHDPTTFYKGKDIPIEYAILHKPDGSTENLELKEKPYCLAAKVVLDQKGQYLVSVKKRSSVYNPAWKGKTGPARLNEAFAKVMIYTGGPQKWDKATGKGAEIIPLVNPHYLVAGQQFKAKFLYNGEPVAKGSYAAAHETENIHDPKVAETGETAKDGTFSITLDKPGMWNIKVELSVDKPGIWKATTTHPKGWYTAGQEVKYDQHRYAVAITLWVAPAYSPAEPVRDSGWAYAAFVIAIIALILSAVSLILRRR